jgi:hypothetical protein
MRAEAYYFRKRRVTMKKSLKYLVAISFLLVTSGVFVASGCSQQVKTLDPGITGPQLIVNPETVRLGVAKIKDTKLFFSGSGFEPGDSVFVKLLKVPVNGKKVDLSIASADIRKDGTFDATVGLLTKVSDFLRAKIGSNEKMENIIIITRPPMPAGIYTARAISMLSDKTADCTLNVKGPSLFNRLKDWLGVKLGKIVRE